MNATYLVLELRRIVRDPATLFFTVGLPAFLYLIFGAAQADGDHRLANGNVAMYVMVGMAAYGAITATNDIGGMAAVERMQGWARQLGLTPMTDAGYVAVKATVALLVACLPVGLVFGLGALTAAEGTGRAWVLSALTVLLGAVTFSLLGLAVGLAFRAEAAVSVASGMLVVLSFLGNLFFPLSGALLELARFTPLYGYAYLARYPVNEGVLTDTDGNLVGADPLWVPITNVLVWTAIFATAAVLLVRRGRARQ